MRSALVALGGIVIVTPAAMGVADLVDDPPGSVAVTTAATGPRAHSTHSAAAAVGTSVLGSDAPAAADHPPAARTEGAVAPAADVRLTVTAPATVVAGDSFTYTLRVANQGPATPSAVVVRILLPEGTVRTGAQLPNGVGGEADGRFGQLVLPPIKPGTSLTMGITVQSQRAGTLVNTTRISYVEGVRDARPRPAVTTVTRVRQRS
ncbi:MAG: hypothetical protein QOE54_5346 [Streptosporangiaceae bacterium]|jgi:uncharacterized repeat protein (TIGR01451 family)|nr:hypothetical protein [Streptosporangiaceae bacterium]MDX6432980.1 hypothetical protein [Streptosporangiaceae bacterium]